MWHNIKMGSDFITLKSLGAKNTIKDENQKEYLVFLKQAIDNKDIKNIAITGPYGSGKTTIINSYIEQEEIDDKVIRISIAKFQSNPNNKPIEQEENTIDPNDQDIENHHDEEKILEQQILQQMIYTVDPSEIPASRFSRIKSWNEEEKRVGYFESMKYIFYALITFILFNSFRSGFWYESISTLDGPYDSLAIVSIIGLIFTWILFTGWIVLQLRIIKDRFKNVKFNAMGNQIEIDEKTNSVFDKYLDEIVYYFKETNYEIVVFEDLDRFNNIEIFESLRNLNYFLNSIDERRIVFIYALRDDIFNDDKNEMEHAATQRTKFFDLIIPTVLITNYSNSEEIFLKELKENEELVVDSHLIRSVSMYINDTRLLQNIINEYKVLTKVLNNASLNKSKIFAMSVYKNVFPDDYSDLVRMNDRSEVLKAIKSKKLYVEENLNKVNTKRDKLLNQLIYVKEARYLSFMDLGILFKEKCRLSYSSYQIDNERYNISRAEEAKLYFDALAEVYVSEINKTADPSLKVIKENYPEWIDLYYTISNKEEKEKQIREQALKEVQQEISTIRTSKVSTLLRGAEFTLSNETENYKLLKFMLLNDWIGEDYNDYITYFYPGQLTESDIHFYRDLQINNKVSFDYPISNVERLLEKLYELDLRNIQIINYDILHYLFIDNNTMLTTEEKSKKDIIKRFMYEEWIEVKKRLNDVIEEDKNYQLILEVLKYVNKVEWFEIRDTHDKKYIEMIMNYFSMKDIVLFNKQGKVAEVIEDEQDFFNYKINFEDEEVYEKLQGIDIEFGKLSNIPQEQKNFILNNIIDYKLYKINYGMFKLFITQDSLSFQAIRNRSSVLKESVLDNPNKFIEVLLSEEEYEESEDNFIDFILTPNIDEDLVMSLLKHRNQKLKNIQKIEDEALIIKIEKEGFLERNDTMLRELISKKLSKKFIAEYLKKGRIQDNLTREQKNTKPLFGLSYEQCAIEIIKNEYISYTDLKELKYLFPRKITLELEKDKLELEKVQFLIEADLLKYTATNHVYILSSFPSEIGNFLYNYVNKIIDGKIPIEFNYDEFEQLIERLDAKETLGILDNITYDNTLHPTKILQMVFEKPSTRDLFTIIQDEEAVWKKEYVKLVIEYERLESINTEQYMDLISWSDKGDVPALFKMGAESKLLNDEHISTIFEKLGSNVTEEDLKILLNYVTIKDSMLVKNILSSAMLKKFSLIKNKEMVFSLLELGIDNKQEIVTKVYEQWRFAELSQNQLLILANIIITLPTDHIEQNLVEEILVLSENEETTAKLLIYWLQEYVLTVNQFQRTVSNLKTSHKNIVSFRKLKFPLKKLDVNATLLKMLHNLDLIASYKVDVEPYLFNTKYELKKIN